LFFGVIKVDATGGIGRTFFGAHGWLPGVVGMMHIGIAVAQIIESHHINGSADAGFPGTTHGGIDITGRVDGFDKGLHHPHNIGTALVGFDGPLFVANAPGNDAGMVAVAHNQSFALMQVVIGDAHQAVLVDDQHAQTVAHIEQLGRGRVV